MAKEDLTTLGFSEEAMSWEPAVAQAPVPEAVMKQEKGFIAGRLWPMLRSCARPQTHLGHPLASFFVAAQLHQDIGELAGLEPRRTRSATWLNHGAVSARGM